MKIFIGVAMLLFFLLPTVTLAKNNDSYPKLANYYLPWDITDEEAKELAQWDLLILHTQAVDRNPNLLQLIKQYNPDLKILAYFVTQEINNNSISIDPYGAWSKIYNQVNNNNWWLRDTAQNFYSFWPETKMINVTTGWNHWLPEYINDYHLKNLPEWDGVFYDNCWPTIDWLNIPLDLNNNGQPDSAATQNNLWSQALTELLNYSQQIFAEDKLIVCNGGTNYRDYYNGRMFETFPLNNEGGWDDNIIDYQQTGEYSIINSNTNNAGDGSEYQDMRFGLTSSLLGNGYFSYDLGDQGHGQKWWYDEYNVSLGKPLASSTFPYSTFLIQRRNFEKGTIVVNASNQPAYFELSAPYEKISGLQDPQVNNGRLVYYLELEPQDGQILLKPIEDLVEVSYKNGGFARVFNQYGQKVRNGFFAYDENYSGGLEILKKDIDNDGLLETFVADNNKLTVYGSDNKQISQFSPYGPGFAAGFHFLVDDINNNNDFEIVTSPKGGGGAHIKTFSVTGRWLNPGFFAYPVSFTGGASIAISDIDHDGQKEIITAPGKGGSYPIYQYTLSGEKLLCSFMPFEQYFSGGVNVASADINYDGTTEIIVSRQSGSADIKIFSCQGKLLSHWLTFSQATQGIELKVVDIDGNGQYEIITLTTEIR